MGSARPTKARFSFADLPELFKRAYLHLSHNDPLRMAGATAFFTTFALPFILILLSQDLGLVINPRQIRREMFNDLSLLFGEQSVRQVIETLTAFRRLAYNGWITAVGILFLLMVSTTLLMVMKGSINQLWRVKMGKEKGGLVRRLGVRLQSVAIILATGLLFLLSIVAEAAKANLGKRIAAALPNLAQYVNSAFNSIVSLLFITLWFALIFRLLPDARPRWRITFGGAFVTAVLFTMGKHVLRLLLVQSDIGSLYGASASLVLVLLFVFYASLILYFGASFTYEWAKHFGQPIEPVSYASRYKVQEVK